jgi:hypothetical protein
VPCSAPGHIRAGSSYHRVARVWGKARKPLLGVPPCGCRPKPPMRRIGHKAGFRPWLGRPIPVPHNLAAEPVFSIGSFTSNSLVITLYTIGKASRGGCFEGVRDRDVPHPGGQRNSAGGWQGGRAGKARVQPRRRARREKRRFVPVPKVMSVSQEATAGDPKPCYDALGRGKVLSHRSIHELSSQRGTRVPSERHRAPGARLRGHTRPGHTALGAGGHGGASLRGCSVSSKMKRRRAGIAIDRDETRDHDPAGR